MKKHPSYIHEPIQEDLAREHFLHRLVAGSAFLFALCILPVSQYFLLGNKAADVGQVEGVATVAPASPSVFADVNGSVASPTPTSLVECLRIKNQDLADLQKFLDGEKKAMLASYEKAVQPYHTQMEQVNPNAPQKAETIANLQKQIDDQYNNNLNQVNNAVATQQDAINNRSCPAQ